MSDTPKPLRAKRDRYQTLYLGSRHADGRGPIALCRVNPTNEGPCIDVWRGLKTVEDGTVIRLSRAQVRSALPWLVAFAEEVDP